MQNNYVTILCQFLNEQVELTIGKLLQVSPSAAIAPQADALYEVLLQAALKNEWETALLSSQWVSNEADPHFAIQLCRLAGDEAKHFQLIEKLTSKKFIFDGIYSPLYQFLSKFNNTFERIVTGPFTREYLAVARNNNFLQLCKKDGRVEIIEIYEEIQKDEKHHHELGVSLMNQIIQTQEHFELAKRLILETLSVVDEMQEIALIKKGLRHLPGC